jgi:hypothetical protein
MALIQKRAKMNDFLVAQKTDTQKPKINSLIRGALMNTSSNIGSYLASSSSNAMIYVYHAEKVRARFKTEITLYTSKAKKGQVKSTKVVKVHEKSWTMRVFAVPSYRVKSVRQMTNYFVLELK